MNALILFIICTTVNVILSTIRSIVTVTGGKTAAAAVNAICYGFYTYIIILTATADLTVWEKIIITAACNFIGVWIVKYIEQRLRKDRLWEIRVTIDRSMAIPMHHALQNISIPHSFDTVHKWAIFNCYAMTSKETTAILEVAHQFNGKTFASENKLL